MCGTNRSAVIHLISHASSAAIFQQLFKNWVRHIVISLMAALERKTHQTISACCFKMLFRIIKNSSLWQATFFDFLATFEHFLTISGSNFDSVY